MTYDKTALRRMIRAEIEALSVDYLTHSDAGILLGVMSLPEFAAARTVMLYSSVGREAGTHKLAKAALEAGKTVAFPYCHKGGIMDARIVQNLSELTPAMLGIPAPPPSAPLLPHGDIDIIIVPALAYDRDGYRLGYGGGYYDRFLRGIPAFTVGLARARLIRDRLPREPHDIAALCLVTENGIIRPPR